ncbi:hypothetical protein J4423_05210 [Candidatus Pacearchaeota archaeon]|nr:hypothetical protein [Candidatus Pacearchaeota archaeon]
MQKKSLVIVSLLIISVLLAWIVMAASGDGVKITSPVIGTNLTSVTSFIFNVSFLNSTDIQNPENATFFINLSGVWSQIGSTSAAGGCNVTETTSSCYANITNTTIPDGVYTVNATIRNATSAISVINATNLTTLLTIDGTKPQAFAQNFTGSVIPYGNLSSLIGGLYYINASLVDLTAGINTVLFNITRSTGVQNASLVGTREGTTNYYSVALNTTHYADGTYNITIFVNDSAGNLNSSARAISYFDDTKPQAFAQNFTGSVASYANLSSSVSEIHINASLIDITAGIGTVLFNITNSTGEQNASLVGTREGTTNYYSAALNTTHFPDGTYNLTIFVNDSAGNLNSSAKISSIILDSTAPSVTISCTPSTATEGGTVTCTCSVSDATSGVNTSYGTNGAAFTANPSTTNTGTHTQSCTGKDKAGNSKTSSTTFNVEGASRSSSRSSSGSGSVSPPSSTSSGSSSTPPSTTNSTESGTGANTGTGASGESQGTNETPKTSNSKWIWALVALVIIVAIVIVVMKRRK